MKLSESWLRSQTNLSIDTNLLVKQLTMAGLEVDSVSSVNAISGVKIAQIDDVQPHPDADKLKVCQVETKTGEFQVVCGAPNAREGILGIFAPENSYIPGTELYLKKTKIRGVESGLRCEPKHVGSRRRKGAIASGLRSARKLIVRLRLPRLRREGREERCLRAKSIA